MAGVSESSRSSPSSADRNGSQTSSVGGEGTQTPPTPVADVAAEQDVAGTNNSQPADGNIADGINTELTEVETTHDTPTPATKSKKRKLNDEMPTEDTAPPKRARRMNARDKCAAAVKAVIEDNKHKARLRTLELAVSLATEAQSKRPEPAPVSFMVQAKIDQLRAFIESHPEQSFVLTDVASAEVPISEYKLYSIVQNLCSDFQVDFAPVHHVLLVEFPNLVTGGIDDEDVLIDVHKFDALDQQIKAKITGHGLESPNILKLEIEMYKESVRQLAFTGRFRDLQTDTLLAQHVDGGLRGLHREKSPFPPMPVPLMPVPFTPKEEKDEEEGEEEEEQSEDKVMGVCPLPMAAVA